MKTIGEYLGEGKLWEEINNVRPFPFITPEMDSLFKLWHGKQWLFSTLEDAALEDLAAIIVHVHGDKWESLLEAQGVPMAAISKRVLDETINSKEDRTNTREDTAKVAAYNSEELLDESGNESSGTDGMEGERVRTLTDSTESVEAAFNNLTRLERLNIVRVAMADVANFMKLDVY